MLLGETLAFMHRHNRAIFMTLALLPLGLALAAVAL